MTIKIIGLIIGLLICGSGIYYLSKEKNDKQSQDIYKITGIIGGVITVACSAALIL